MPSMQNRRREDAAMGPPAGSGGDDKPHDVDLNQSGSSPEMKAEVEKVREELGVEPEQSRLEAIMKEAEAEQRTNEGESGRDRLAEIERVEERESGEREDRAGGDRLEAIEKGAEREQGHGEKGGREERYSREVDREIQQQQREEDRDR